MDRDKILNKILGYLREESPTINIGSGNIAGSVESGDDPPVRRKKKRYISLGTGSRSRWTVK
jgi:hypothetical protein